MTRSSAAKFWPWLPLSAELIDVGKRCGRKLLTQEEINALLVVLREFA